MTAKQLLYFVTIAETGSFTLAAEKLHLSQPPLSKQIMLLEDELNTQLLIRSSRRIKLTESGVLLYNRAKDILRMMDTAVADLSSQTGKPRGIVRLGVVKSTGDLLLNQKLTAFYSQCPDVMLDLHESDTNTLIDQIKGGKLDAAIVEMPINTDELDCRMLPEDTFMVVGKPVFFPPEAKAVTLNDLIGRPLLYCRSHEHALLSHFEEAGLPHRCLCRSCDIRSILLMACNGHGVAIVPRSIALAAQLHDDVTILPLEEAGLTMQLAFVSKTNAHRCQAIQALAKLF